ncbi:hypothetical protein BPAE_0092g00180 [Botrytis paeoniae]|uniref:Uncharacterized protein n=1 Tax=Botrytis paeoniae TaxID=278948 RepID=A0A4Z1FPG6_9HELO|nr:hypothetical protein BPAE_0092g00180 [Botrytis paeoniae]
MPARPHRHQPVPFATSQKKTVHAASPPPIVLPNVKPSIGLFTKPLARKSHKLGILLSPDKKSPDLLDLSDVDRFLTYGSGDSYDSEQLLIKPQWIMRARNIKHTLAVYMRDNFGSDGSKMTQSASSITAGKMKHNWKGALVVVAMDGQSAPQSKMLKMGRKSLTVGTYVAFQKSIDITLKDFRVVHDYFLAYPHELESKLTLKDQCGNTVI